jgi:hypothetical protein
MRLPELSRTQKFRTAAGSTTVTSWTTSTPLPAQLVEGGLGGVHKEADMLGALRAERAKGVLAHVRARHGANLLDQFEPDAGGTHDMGDFDARVSEAEAPLQNESQHVTVPTRRLVHVRHDQSEVVELPQFHGRPPSSPLMLVSEVERDSRAPRLCMPPTA